MSNPGTLRIHVLYSFLKVKSPCTIWRLIVECQYRGADKSLAWWGRKQARKHFTDAHRFNNIETPVGIRFAPPPPPLQGTASKEIHAILTDTLSVYTLNLGSRRRLVVTFTIFPPYQRGRTSGANCYYSLSLGNFFMWTLRNKNRHYKDSILYPFTYYGKDLAWSSGKCFG